MRRNKTEELKDVLLKFLRIEGLETPLKEYRLMNSWNEIVGDKIGKYTDSLYIKNQVLYVKLKSPSLRNNLNYKKQDLIKRLNENAGSKMIVNIVFN